MDTYLSEQEQAEQVKKWLRDNGLMLVSAILLGLLISFGWHRFQMNKERALEHASVRYEQLLGQLEQNNTQAAHDTAEYLIKRYPKTAYAALAKFIQARIAIDNHDLTLATTAFDWVIDHAASAPIKEMARIRKARVLLALNQPQAALKTLEHVDDAGFVALTESIKGEAYTALKQFAEARIAYQAALRNMPETQNIRPLIQMKLDNLPID